MNRRHLRTWRAIAVATAMLCVAVAGCDGPSSGTGPNRRDVQKPNAQRFSGQLDPSVPLCGYPDPSSATASTQTPPAHPVHTLISIDSEVSTFALSSTSVFVFSYSDQKGNVVTRYGLDGSKQASFVIHEAPSEIPAWAMSQVAIGPDGSLYTIGTGNNRWSVTKTSSSGQQQWTSDLSSKVPQNPGLGGIFAWHDSSGKFAIGVGVNDTSVFLLDSNGKLLGGSLKLAGNAFMPQPDGSLLTFQSSSDSQNVGSYVRSYDKAGKLVARFGGQQTKAAAEARTASTSGTGGEYLMGNPRGLATTADGQILILDSHLGLERAAADGTRRGAWTAPGTASDQSFTVLDGSPLIHHDGSYYFLATGDNGSSRLVRISDHDMMAGLHTPLQLDASTEPAMAVLGYGAGLSTSAPLGYFAAGQQPAVWALFDPWWTSLRDKYTLRYTVRGDPRQPALPTAQPTPLRIPDGGGKVALKLPETEPGIYEVSLELFDKSGHGISGTCLRYSVGAAGQRLDPATLAPGADWGGPAPLRGVQLADELGIGSYRMQLDFGQLVTDPEARPSASGLSWDSLTNPEGGGDPWADLAAAVKLARERHVVFILQVGQGGEAEKVAVDHKTWEGWIKLIIQAVQQHTDGVIYWAPCNEPNNAGYDGRAYVDKVLKPFAAAAATTDDAVKIVDANTLGVSLHWWKQYINAGGLDETDVIAVHPYTGFNESWEEWGMNRTDGEVDQLLALLRKAGAKAKPVWDTESGWWSDGPASFWQQGDDVARQLMWNRYQGVSQWTYFFSEGGFEPGKSWSLIQHGSYLKTGALAFMTTSAMLSDHAKPAIVRTGIPFTYAMRFASTSGKGNLLAAWTDEFPVSAKLSLASSDAALVTATNEYGASHQIKLEPGKPVTVRLGGSPVFYTAPPHVELELGPVESFGTDVLRGQPVTASSSAADTTPSVLTSGSADTRQPWRSGPKGPDGKPDLTPRVTVTMKQPTTINRIAVATPGIRCCTTGLRDYTVEIKTADGWRTVDTVRDQFFDRVKLISFKPVRVEAVRVSVPSATEKGVRIVSANYSGYTGGLHPSWMKLVSSSDGAVSMSDISAWEPGK